jgi:hypothetical protein
LSPPPVLARFLVVSGLIFLAPFFVAAQGTVTFGSVTYNSGVGLYEVDVFYNNPIPNLTFLNIEVEFDIADRDFIEFDVTETQNSTTSDIDASLVNGGYFGFDFDNIPSAGTPVDLGTNDLVGTIYFSILSGESVDISFREIQIADNMSNFYTITGGDYSSAEFTFSAPLIEIKGQVIEFAGLDGLENASVDGNNITLTAANFDASDETPINGRFELVAVAGSDYIVTVNVDGDQDGGDGCVNTFDVSRFTDHLNGIDVFTEPGEFLSADVNGNGSLNTLDNIQVNKVALDIDPNAFDVNWIALPLTEYNGFSDPASSVPTVDGELDVTITSSTVTGKDFLAIKGGDTDKSCDDAIATLKVPQEKKLPINIPLLSLSSGESFSLPIYGPNFMNTNVISFSFSISQDVEITGLKSETLQLEDYHYHIRDQKVDVIWFTYDPVGKEIKSDEPLFYIEGIASQNISDASELISTRNDRPYGNVIIEVGTSEYSELELNSVQPVQDIKQNIERRTKSNLTSSVQPNPFYSTFTINVESTENTATKSTVRVFDNLTGIEVLERIITINPGTNTISINGLQNKPAGVYTYQIKLGQEIISGKVLKVE